MKALQPKDLQQNKEILCTLDSDESVIPDNTLFSPTNSTLISDQSSLRRRIMLGTRNTDAQIKDQSYNKILKNGSITIDSFMTKRKVSGLEISKPEKLNEKEFQPLPDQSPVINKKVTLPPYRQPKHFQANPSYMYAYQQQQSLMRRHSRENSMYSAHTRRSSISIAEKTNLSGWSFMLNSPVMSIFKLVSKDSQDLTQDVRKRESGVLNAEQDLVDLTPFKVENKHIRSLNNIAIQLFNQDSMKSLSFMLLFRLVKPNSRDIALLLHKADLPDSVKRNLYQVMQLLGNPNLKEALDILHQYASFFRFENMTFLEALRLYLSNFLFEVDPEKVDWILRGFTKKYYASTRKLERPGNNAIKSENRPNRDTFETPEAVHMLAFTAVMLDISLRDGTNNEININNQRTELAIKNEFHASLAYVNGGENFSSEFIDEIYEGVKAKQIIKLVNQVSDKNKERLVRFAPPCFKVNVKAKKISKKNKEVVRNYILYFEGNVCYVVKDFGEKSELKALFMAKGCKAVRKDKKIRFMKIGAERREEIHYAKFRPTGEIVVSSRQEILFLIDSIEEVSRVQKYLDS